MTWPIWIGVDASGEPLIGAHDVKKAESIDRLHDRERVFPSQIPHRVASFYPDREGETRSGYRGVDPNAHGRDMLDKYRDGRWRVVTPSQAEADNAAGICRSWHRKFKARSEMSIRVQL
jgi:hypothetical protein